MGPYSLVTDGKLNRDDSGSQMLDGLPDGEILLGEDATWLLGVSTPENSEARNERRSNWYLARVYEDTRPNSVYRYWRLLVCYYTGELDIPGPLPDMASTPRLPWRWRSDRFLDSVKMECRLRTGFSRWEGPTSSCRIRLQRSYQERTWQIGHYEIAMRNGEPVDSWAAARREMKIDSSKPCFAGRVQVAPDGPVHDWPKADKAAKEFLQHVMPAILRTMPSADQMEE